MISASNVKFLVKLGKDRTEAYDMLITVYGEQVMNKVTFYKWYKAFKEGRESIGDMPREGRPSTSRTSGRTVTADYYISVLTTMLQHFKKKWPKRKISEILLHHDNARPHVAHSVVEFLDKYGIQIVPHPPYSPDLAPCDFWLFPEIKFPLRGRKFKSNNEVVKAVEAECKRLGKDGLKFVFQKWQERWQKCIATEGGYFEKEHVDLED